MHLNLLPIFSKEDVVGIGDRDGRIKGWGKGDGSHKQMGETVEEYRLFHQLEVILSQ